MKLREYIENQDRAGVRLYAERCLIASSYLRLHVKYATKNPSVALIKALARESEGQVSLIEVLEHFGITDESVTRAAA